MGAELPLEVEEALEVLHGSSSDFDALRTAILAHVREQRVAALEEAARVCDENARLFSESTCNISTDEGSIECASLIRALAAKEEKP